MPVFRKNKGHKRKIMGVGLLVFVIWLGGLFRFIDTIPKTPQYPDRKTEAIVVLTGGTLRLEEGLDLLEKGLANKLFVSGVHPAVNVEKLLRLSRETPSKLDCCITLGYEADNTQGNAMETALWMREQGFTSMRLITGGYHMPRSLMELRHVLPDTEIILNPVFPGHVKLDDWYLWPGTTWLVIGEYNKTIFIPIRRLLARLIADKD